MPSSGSETGLSLGPMIGTVNDASKATSFTTSELTESSLKGKTKLTGTPTLGGPIAYPKTDPRIQNFHFYSGWIDFQFTLEASDGVPAALRGTHWIRLVTAPVSDSAYTQGDLLYRADTETAFRWCVTGSGCTATTRPSSPVVYSAIKTWSNPHSEGNQTIPSFFINVKDGTTKPSVTEEQLKTSSNTNLFTVDFHLTDGLKFSTSPVSMTALDEMVSAFRIPFDSTEKTAFTATITYDPTGT